MTHLCDPAIKTFQMNSHPNRLLPKHALSSPALDDVSWSSDVRRLGKACTGLPSETAHRA
ncbi:hypothetical protein [Roseobacter litoralis]|uniref:hypothetical protein n=1 Tax=Roseobacter litoralis TaxID=42443 RepID=UPI0024940C52|nr:hypothetical protein [Roseobacter litoralis]